MDSQKYPPYEEINEIEEKKSISQGELIYNCPVIVPPKEIKDDIDLTQVVEVIEYDVVVMSQSCDLEAEKIEIVLVCPLKTLSEFLNTKHNLNEKGKRNLSNDIREGHIFRNHLLHKIPFDNYTDDYLIVDFSSVYGVPFVFLKEFVKKSDKRIRLLPPYREHLSQAFARFFMRVGLPTDIPSFKKK